MFFWLSLSTIKCSGVPFTHICEWKSCSPSSGSSSGWIVAVVTVEVGYASMICLLLLFSELDTKLGFHSLSLSSTANDCIERHSLLLCQGILWNSHHFLVSFLDFLLPLFSYIWDYLSQVFPSFICPSLCELDFPFPCFSHLLCYLSFYSILTAYR
jgi:hypothetical protein